MEMAFAFMAYANRFEKLRKKELDAHIEAAKLPVGFGAPVIKIGGGDSSSSVGSSSGAASGGPVLKPQVAPTVAVTVASPAELGRPKIFSQAAPAPVQPVAEPATASQAVVALSEQDKENLAKISLFTNGEVSIPVNTATEAELLALAKDMLAAGHAVFGGAQDVPIEVIAEVAAVEGELKAKVQGLDKEAITDVIMAVEPRALGPEDTAKARAEGRAFVDKMALGTSYLEMPVPPSNFSIATFQDAVDSLAEAVMRRDDKPSN
jgi:hypothetical protein